jgi:segregation and condensation protein A
MEAYRIKIDAFEGPFDLLFHLIEKNKIDIYDIPVSVIADQYMEHIFAMQEMDLDIASEFLVMASTLLHIKTRLMLPPIAPQDGESEDESDPRDELVISILEYRRYKSLAADLKSNELYWRSAYFRDSAAEPGAINLGFGAGAAMDSGMGGAGAPEDFSAGAAARAAFGMGAGSQLSFLPDAGEQPYDRDKLAAAYRRLLERNRQKMNAAALRAGSVVEREKVPLIFKIREVLRLLKEKPQFIFQSAFDIAERTRLDVVTAFIAILELSKQERVSLRQRKLFGGLMVCRKEAKDDSAA